MNVNNRYQFSVEAQPSLLGFLKAVKIKNHVGESSKIWEKYLRKDETLKKQILSQETDEKIKTEGNKSIIDLTESNDSDDVVLKQTRDCLQDLTLHENINEDRMEVIKLKSTSISDVVRAINETLGTKSFVSDDVFNRLVTECTEEDAVNAFGKFCETLNKESVCKLGYSIIIMKSCEKNAVARYFNRCILMPKLFTSHDDEMQKLFLDFLNNFLDVTSQEFSNIIQKNINCYSSFQKSFSMLANNYKQKLLRDLVTNTSKLEKLHITVVDSLLIADTDLETFQKLIDLLLDIASNYSSDKFFGILLLNLISQCSKLVMHFEQQLKHIVATHRSVRKGKIQKLLDDCMDNSMMLTQSIRY